MSAPNFEKYPVFESQTKGYYCYRIPALVRTSKGTLIAFCEARQRSCSDWAHSAIMARRCSDPLNHFDAWDEQFIVQESQRLVEPKGWGEILEAGRLAEEKGWDQDDDDFEPKIDVVTGNPVPIVDQDGKTIHLVYCVHYDSAFYTCSEDDGVTWSEPVEITGVLNKMRRVRDWTVIAAGPGQGLQLMWGLHAGRLIVPFWFALNPDNPSSHANTEVGVIFSDDGGNTWEAGDYVPSTIFNPNETQAVQLTDGRVLLNSRNMHAKSTDNPVSHRALSWSKDGAHDWTEFKFDPALPEPICMGSFLRFTSDQQHEKSQLLFSLPNPEAIGEETRKRVNLTVWLSEDEGQTWPVSRSIGSGGGAYSDLAVDPDNGWIYCLYEGGFTSGDQGPYSGQSIVKFNLDWLKK